MVLLDVLVYALLALFLLYAKLRFFKSRVERMLLKIPGPPYNTFVGNLRRLKVKREVLYETIMNICKEHPKSPLVRLWLFNKPWVIITKAEGAEVLMNNSKQIDKAESYKLISDWLRDGLILTGGGPKWFNRRRLITPTFHFKILDQFREIMNEQSAIFVNIIAENKDNYFNVSEYLTRCTLDILAESAMGAKLGCQSGSAEQYLKSIMGVGDIHLQRVFKFWLRNDFIFHKLSKSGRLQKEYLKYLHGFTRNMINERKAQFKIEKAMRSGEEQAEEDVYGRKRRLAFLDMLLEARDKGNVIDDDGIQEEVDMFLFAGHDTTANATAWILWNLAHHPEIQEKLVAELDDVLGVDELKNVSSEQAAQLKYLECVIKESMRTCNTVPFFSRRLTQDINICGYDLPAGIDVSFLPQLIHDDPAHWPNPYKFDPDRFLPENAANRHPYAYVPFSAGVRNCIGQRFAITELKVLVSHIVHRYEIFSEQKREDMDLLAELIMRPAQGIWIRIKNRRRDY